MSTGFRNTLAIIAFVIALGFAFAFSQPSDGATESTPRSLDICAVFGDRYCGEALRVAWCESRFDTEARNGQYRGIFQMGSWERRRWGHGRTALAQARAAHRYFVVTGKDWSPWECKP